MLQFLDFGGFLSLCCSRKMILMMLMVVIHQIATLLATKRNVGSKLTASRNLTLELSSCGWASLLSCSHCLCYDAQLRDPVPCLNDTSIQFYLFQVLDIPLPHQ